MGRGKMMAEEDVGRLKNRLKFRFELRGLRRN